MGIGGSTGTLQGGRGSRQTAGIPAQEMAVSSDTRLNAGGAPQARGGLGVNSLRSGYNSASVNTNPSTAAQSGDSLASLIDELLLMHRQQIREVSDMQKEETKAIAGYTTSVGHDQPPDPNVRDAAFAKYLADVEDLLMKKKRATDEMLSLVRKFQV